MNNSSCSDCGNTPVVRQGQCKRCCDHAYYLANAERIKARVHAYAVKHAQQISNRMMLYRQEHRKELNAKALAYHHQDPSKQAKRSARWKSKNRELLRNQAKTLYAANPARGIAYSRKWQLAHPEAKRELDHRYRARKNGAFVEKVEPDEIYKRDKGLCQICNKSVDRKQMVLDHIVPLARGGTHEPKNVQVAHRRCNNKRWVTGPAQTRLV